MTKKEIHMFVQRLRACRAEGLGRGKAAVQCLFLLPIAPFWPICAVLAVFVWAFE